MSDDEVVSERGLEKKSSSGSYRAPKLPPQTIPIEAIRERVVFIMKLRAKDSHGLQTKLE